MNENHSYGCYDDQVAMGLHGLSKAQEETIGYTRTSFSMIAFFDEEDNELMELQGILDDYTMRVPNIGERVILASYEHDHTNDDKAVFRNFYKVVDVITHYSENRAYKNVSVQYSVILRKEVEK